MSDLESTGLKRRGASRRRAPAVIAAAVIAAAVGCRGRGGEEDILLAPQAPPVEEEQRYVVERGDVVKKIQFLSNVAPVEEHKQFFRADGRINRILVREGDWVRAGQVLADMEMVDLLNRVEQARVNVEKMQMRLQEIRENRVNIARARTEFQIKELELAGAEGRDPEIDVTVARANQDKAALALEAVRLADQVYGPREPSLELREAQLNHVIAEAAYRKALEAREQHRIRIATLAAELELARLKLRELEVFTDPQAITDLKLAELSLKQLEDQAAMFRVVSPIAGKVMSVNVVVGSEIKAYRPAVIVADPTTFEISADLLRDESMQLYVGQQAQIELVDQPGRVLEGTVRRLPYGGLQGTDFLDTMDRSTRIRFDPPEDLRLEVGDLARATVVLETRTEILFLPPEAVRVFQGRRFVVVEEGERRRRVDVRAGLEGDDRIEVEGLEAGMVVVGQ